MGSKSKSNNVNSLLAAIQRKVTTSPIAVEDTPQSAVSVEAPAKGPRRKVARSAVTISKPIGRVGKPVQFWLHDQDRQLVRELAAWLAGQGQRTTDSTVIRAALRTAKTGGEFLDAYRQASQLDGRLKQHKVG